MQVSKRVLGLGCAVTVASGLILAGPPASGSTPQAPASSQASESSSSQSAKQPSKQSSDRASTVTLITGDTVTSKGDRELVVEPGPGRDDVMFHKRSDGEHQYVIPSDAQDLVTAGTLDRRLFDITELVEQGYDDASSDELPLIVSYADEADRADTTRTLASADIRTTTTLSSVNGAAVTVDRAGTQDGWAALRSAAQDNELERIWLDGKREALLDKSVPQIGAPEAWDAGYTGEGTQVAVLDTGIDAEHPDLADAVAAAKDFSGSASGPRDKNGHGTHVASTIAGSGQASDGKYVGVAPDAELLVGKVLDDDGFGTESQIVKGMEWAAETKQADVVSMSLGGYDSPGKDPLEKAVGTLTNQTGALFVIAAGNDGPAAESIGSPASAPASLAVGAVTKQDELAEFSSRGPAPGDGALKPDITAPGANIVAAKARGTSNPPVDGQYTGMSGTSMATPHVAGAAALLAQQHEGWSAPELKSALMASAKPNQSLGVYEQGAGRVDLGTAIEQTVISEPASIQFGVQRWPHHDDEPVEKKLTYRNVGDEPVEIDLRADLTDPKGDPAPDGAIELSADTVTVPAGKTASVTVTADTRVEGPDGQYSGTVVGSVGQQRVITPIAVEREVESYDLTLKAIGPDGDPAPANAYLTMVRGSHDTQSEHSLQNGKATVRVPKGEYLFEAFMDGQEGSYVLVQPRLEVDQDGTVTADARKAKPLSTTVQRDNAKVVSTDVGFFTERFGNPEDGYQSSLWAENFEQIFTGQVGPPGHSDGMTGYVGSQWAKNGKVRNSPYTYSLFEGVPGRFPTGYEREVSDQELAEVKSTYNVQQPGLRGEIGIFAGLESLFMTTSVVFRNDPPSDVTHYVDGGDIRVSQGFDLAEKELEYVGTYSSEERTYPIGETTKEHWNAAVFAPWSKAPYAGAERVGDQLSVAVPMYSDAAGHFGDWAVDQAKMVLKRDGKQIASSQNAGLLEAEVPAGDAQYQLRATANRSSTAKFSTKTEASWTFRSDTAGDDGTVLPIWSARFEPKVNRQNVQQDSDGVSTLPVSFAAPDGFEQARIADAKLEVSTNDGESWKAVELEPNGRNSYLAEVRTPEDASFVSLRATATDVEGNESTIEVIRAYGVTR